MTLPRAILDLRLSLRTGGYDPIPTDGKIPAPEAWQKLRGVTPQQVGMWNHNYPRAGNTGILTGPCPTLDIDILNPGAADAVEKLVRDRYEGHGRCIVRTGLAPKRAIPFRTDVPFPKITIQFENGGRLEFLAAGQQVIVAGIHPTGTPYTWDGGEPWTVPRSELPFISGAEAIELMEDLAELLVKEHGYARKAERAHEPAPFITLVHEPVSEVRKDAYGQKALDNIASELAAVVEGNGQNDAAYFAGLKVGSLIAGGCLSEGEAHSRLVSACQSGWGKPRDRAYGRKGAIANGIRDGKHNPRGPDDYDSWIASYDFSVLLAKGGNGLDHDPETGEVYEAPATGAGAPTGSAGAKPGGNAGTAPQMVPIEPVDLWAKFDPPSLPRGLLPQLLEDFTFERSAVMGCDPTGLALGALAVCAASIPEDVRIQPKRNDTKWQESARLWVALVGGVSEMKSPILDTVAGRIREIDYEMERAYQEALSKYFALDKQVREKTPKPKHLRTKIMNTTVEAAADILKDSPNGVLLEQDELSGWFGSMDKYAGSRGAQADRAFWLISFNGKPYTVDRVVRGSTYIPHLSVSILGFIQPEPIRKIADSGEDDGLMQRFITGILTPAVKGGDVAPGPALFDYEDMIDRLRKLRPPPSVYLHPPDAVLTFDDGALKIREELEDKHRELQQCKSINRKLTSHIGKYNGIFARLCLTWHCIEHANDTALPAVITENTARRVADFLHNFLLKHALAFYAGVLGLSNDHDRLSNIAGYILAHQNTRLTNRDIQRGDRSMRNLKDYDTGPIFEQLEAFGWLMRIPGARFSAPLNWAVNPIVHQRFADRAKAELERRERDQKIIAEYLTTRGSG